MGGFISSAFWLGVSAAGQASAFFGINTALNQKLQAYAAANSREVAYENIGYEPTEGTTYLRPSVLPDATVQAERGTSGQRKHEGVFRIDVVTSIDEPKAIALNEADAVASYFARGLTLIYSGINVRLGTASIGAASRERSWYVVPVLINYHSFTSARVAP